MVKGRRLAMVQQAALSACSEDFDAANFIETGSMGGETVSTLPHDDNLRAAIVKDFLGQSQ